MANSDSTPPTWPKQLETGGETFKKRVDSPAMFRAYMFAKMPSLGITTAYIDEIDVERCTVALPFGWPTRDLFGRVATSAIVAAAEAASVSLLVLNIRNQGASLLPRVKSLKVISHTDVKEELRLECQDGRAHAALIAQAKESQLPETATLTILAKRTSDQEVSHEVHIEWEVHPK